VQALVAKKVKIMANLQVKSINDDLYRSLGRRASMENRSISQEVVAILKDYLSSPSQQHSAAHDAFIGLCAQAVDSGAASDHQKGKNHPSNDWIAESSSEELIKELRQQRGNPSKHRDIDF